jgi:hypothetical protein
MKIGIYGDSFAIGSPMTKSFHWYTVLGQLLNAEVTTYGLGGTPLIYSYKKIFENHEKYDLNIFLATHYERYPTPIYFSCTGKNTHWGSSINQLQNYRTHLRGQLSSDDIIYISKLESWFVVSDDEFMKTSQECMIRNIVSKIPNLVVLPCFHKDYSFTDELKSELNIGPNSSCWDFLQGQRRFFEITDKTQDRFYERQDKIACHFTEDTNKLYAQSVYDFIINKKTIEAPQVVQHQHNRDYYYHYE